MSEEILAWYSGLEGPEQAAKEKGLRVENGMGVLSVRKSELLHSVAVHKTLKIKYPGVIPVPFQELWNYQYEEILNFLKKLNIELTEEYLEGLDENLSQIVYDDRERIRGLILCRSVEEETMVELLVGSKKATHFIMAALQGFVSALVQSGEEDRKIIMLAATDTVIPLLNRVLDKKYQYQELGVVHCIREEAGTEFEEILSEAEEGCLYQKNIRWKYPWSVSSQRAE